MINPVAYAMGFLLGAVHNKFIYPNITFGFADATITK